MGVGWGGGGRAADEDDDGAADVWSAAGMEQARAASARQCAAIDACRHAWTAEAESGTALLEVVRANDGIVAGPGGGVRRGPIADAAAALRRSIDAMERAAVEFSQASKLSDVAADGWGRAAEAFGRAGTIDRIRAARDRADEARKMARGMEGHAARSRASAASFEEAANGWVARSAEWEDGDTVVRGSDGWPERRDRAQGVAEGRRARAEDMAQRTLAAARLAEAESAHLAAGTKSLTAGAVALLKNLHAPEAAAALRDGMEAASRAVRDR